MQIPQAEKGKICPLHKKDMSKVCATCPWWTRLQGKDPLSKEQKDEWGCAIAWLPMLLCENSQQTRQSGAAIESFRNEMTNVGRSLLMAAEIKKEIR